jgi:hypothetical protein
MAHTPENNIIYYRIITEIYDVYKIVFAKLVYLWTNCLEIIICIFTHWRAGAGGAMKQR